MTEAMPEIDASELMMVNTLVVAPGRLAEYREALRKVLPPARALEGNLLLEVGESVGTPGTFVLTERWRSGIEYVERYLALPFYREYLAKTESMYSIPRVVEVLRSI